MPGKKVVMRFGLKKKKKGFSKALGGAAGGVRGLSETQIAAFVRGGTGEKTRFQLAKEEREKKAAAAAAENAKAYADFVASFAEGGDDGRGKTFVRGGVFQAGDGGGASDASAGRPGSTYHLGSRSASGGKKAKLSQLELLMRDMKDEAGGGSAPAAAASAAGSSTGRKGKAKKVRELDLMLEEMKREGPVKLPASRSMGSFGHGFGDETTTNLYVGNLAPTVTEETLQRKFGRYGDLISVKVMWPRTEEERMRKRNSGFVAYRLRADAEAGLQAMQEKSLEGYVLRIGWAKAVPHPERHTIIRKKITTPDDDDEDGAGGSSSGRQDGDRASTGRASTATSVSSRRKGRRSNWDVKAAVPAAVPGVPPVPVATGPPLFTDPTVEMPEGASKVEVATPDDDALVDLIDRLSWYVAKDGIQFESAIMATEQGNPESQFKFMFDLQSPAGRYYRWRVISLVMGDTLEKWSEKPFRVTHDGPWWIPPQASSSSKAKAKANTVAESRKRGRRSRSRSRSRSRGKRRGRDRRSSSSDGSRGRSRKRRRHRVRSVSSSEEVSDGESGRDRKKRSDRSMRAADVEELDYIIKHTTMRRSKIKEAMGFALDNADFATQIATALRDSLMVVDTPAPKKVARLFLVSDILHNSSAGVKNASIYRTRFMDHLPDIFESLNKKRLEITGRITSSILERKVLSVLEWWNRSSLYPPTYIGGLEATFLRPADGGASLVAGEDESKLDAHALSRKCKLAGVSPSGSALDMLRRLRWAAAFAEAKSKKEAEAAAAAATAAAAAELAIFDESLYTESAGAGRGPVAAAPATNPVAPASAAGGGASGWAVVDSDDDGGGNMDIDGEALDGEPIDGEELDGEPIDGEALDGKPLDGEDLDGEPMEDIDGEPM